jgi:Spy/CpxP family protein refolding chaperone
MIKKQIILPTLLLASILIGGMTGCSSSKSPDVSQGDNSGGTKVSDTNASATNSPASNTSRAEKNEAVRKQIEAVLTPDQAKELSGKLQKGEKMRKALFSLNLTPDQKTKIKDILKTAYPHRKGQSQDNS